MAKDKRLERIAGNGTPKYTNRTRLQEANLPEYSRLPPQAPDLEEAILSGILIEKEAMTKVLDILAPESFYRPAHQAIFRSMRRLFERSQPIDIFTVMEDLRKTEELANIGGAAYLTQLSLKVTSSANIEYHARIVTEKFIQRELIRTSTEIIHDAYEDSTDVLDLLDKAGNFIFEITEKNMGKQVADMGSLANQILEQLTMLREKEDGLTGIPTGFTELDRLTSGLQPSDLIIVAARPAMGKTSFVLSMARHAAVEYGKGVALFSLEMSAAQLAGRIFSQDAEVNGQKMRNGKFDDAEWARLVEAMNRIGEAPIYIDDTAGINVFELRAKCRRLKLEKGISMVIIDYLQLMSGSGESNKGMNREQEVSGISRALKGLAKELEVPVIALSQLSRAVETRGGDKRPQLSDLRESGCLAGDTLVTVADEGKERFARIKDLVNEYPNGGFKIWARNTDGKLVRAEVSRGFCTGTKQVFALTTTDDRHIEATANHKFYTSDGWKRLDELEIGSVIRVTANRRPWDQHHGAYAMALVEPDHNRSADTFASIASITPTRNVEVFDLTVPGPHNFVANDIIVHNSIEQDADMVMFLYRPEYYKILEDEQGNSLVGTAEIIIGKNRHGESKDIRLAFESNFARFSDLGDPDFSLLPDSAIQSAQPGGAYGSTTIPSKMNTDEDIPF